jgi:N-acetylglutamate synthase-like GNAT family acetyltransferase
MDGKGSVLELRRAVAGEEEAVRSFLCGMDLLHRGFSISRCWVASDSGRVVAAAQIEPAGDAVFVSSVGVAESRRGEGIGSSLVAEMTRGEKRDVYLDTVIPGFFSPLGFEPAERPAWLPSKSQFYCSECDPERCVCMVRRKDAI